MKNYIYSIEAKDKENAQSILAEFKKAATPQLAQLGAEFVRKSRPDPVNGWNYEMIACPSREAREQVKTLLKGYADIREMGAPPKPQIL